MFGVILQNNTYSFKNKIHLENEHEFYVALHSYQQRPFYLSHALIYPATCSLQCTKERKKQIEKPSGKYTSLVCPCFVASRQYW